ncbi:MAG: hypothetical protein AAF226_12825, partial [Verrucomicrobiota bacterium]
MAKEVKRIMESDRSTPVLGEKIAESISVNDLMKPRERLAIKVKSCENGEIKRVGNEWHVTGKAPIKLSLVPADGEKWDISTHRLLGVPVLNRDKGLSTLDGRLNNGGLTGWSHHAVGFSVAPAGEKTTLGFPFPVVPDRYHGPSIFKDQYGKPNGHRIHWRNFYPDDVRELTIEFESSTGVIDLALEDPFLAWPATSEIDATLHAMPYLDEFGQVRAVDWPGKASSANQIRKVLQEETAKAKEQAKTRKLSQYGGWLEGPKLKATGRFRAQKVDGKWWLVDPEGYLFFSVGVCLAGHKNETPYTQERIDSNFFAWYPDDDHHLRWIGRKKQGNKEYLHFPPMTFSKAFGQDWEAINRDGNHHRIRAWGLNTLGAWCDEGLQKGKRTPYTLMSSIWWKKGYGSLPAPFRENFEADIRESLKEHLWAKDDPYCLGMFLGNELGWTQKFSNRVFELNDDADDETTKVWLRGRLRDKYPELTALNQAWGTEYKKWEELFDSKPKTITPTIREDIDPLFMEFASTFFRRCKKAMNDVLPGVLYLGCRVNQAPNELGRAAQGHVDAYSINIYDSEVRTWHVPDDVDIPILNGEFHYGAVDRGVPSPGLSTAWDQRQRGLAFSHYLASALAEPRFVGVQWFQWYD